MIHNKTRTKIQQEMVTNCIKQERTVIDCYKELPEAHSIPDEVWDCQKAVERVAMLHRMLSNAEQEKKIAIDKMLQILMDNWSIAEIDSTGIRDCM